MKTRTRTVITFEALQRTVITRRTRPVFIRCPYCVTAAAMLSPNEFGRLNGLTSREIYRQVEAGAFHFVEDKGGKLLICENSSINEARDQRR